MNKANKYAHLADGTVLVMLERRDGNVLPCFVDAQDWVKVRSHRWCATKKQDHTHYAATSVRKPDGKKTTLLMHRLLLPDAKMVDHKNQNGLDNQKHNLRPATRSQNHANSRKQKNGVTSAYRGVCRYKNARKFVAQIQVDGKVFYLGYFTNEEDAAIAYNIAASHHFGVFAKLNDIQPAQQLSKAA